MYHFSLVDPDDNNRVIISRKPGVYKEYKVDQYSKVSFEKAKTPYVKDAFRLETMADGQEEVRVQYLDQKLVKTLLLVRRCGEHTILGDNVVGALEICNAQAVVASPPSLSHVKLKNWIDWTPELIIPGIVFAEDSSAGPKPLSFADLMNEDKLNQVISLLQQVGLDEQFEKEIQAWRFIEYMKKCFRAHGGTGGTIGVDGVLDSQSLLKIWKCIPEHILRQRNFAFLDVGQGSGVALWTFYALHSSAARKGVRRNNCEESKWFGVEIDPVKVLKSIRLLNQLETYSAEKRLPKLRSTLLLHNVRFLTSFAPAVVVYSSCKGWSPEDKLQVGTLFMKSGTASVLVVVDSEATLSGVCCLGLDPELGVTPVHGERPLQVFLDNEECDEPESLWAWVLQKQHVVAISTAHLQVIEIDTGLARLEGSDPCLAVDVCDFWVTVRSRSDCTKNMDFS